MWRAPSLGLLAKAPSTGRSDQASKLGAIGSRLVPAVESRQLISYLKPKYDTKKIM